MSPHARSILDAPQTEMSQAERRAHVAHIRAIPPEQFSPDPEVAEVVSSLLVLLAADGYDVDAYTGEPSPATPRWTIWVRPANPAHEGTYTPAEWTEYMRMTWPHFACFQRATATDAPR